MANVNAAMGFRPVRHLFGGSIRTNQYGILSGASGNIFRGDPVKTTGTTKNIIVATAGDRIVGIFAGCFYDDGAGSNPFHPYWPTAQTLKTGTLAYALVWDDPHTLFSAQVSGTAGMIATDIGNFADGVAATGSTLTGNSAWMLDQATLTATTATGGQFKIYDIDPVLGNAVGQYCKALVLINEGENTAGTTAGAATNAV